MTKRQAHQTLAVFLLFAHAPPETTYSLHAGRCGHRPLQSGICSGQYTVHGGTVGAGMTARRVQSTRENVKIPQAKPETNEQKQPGVIASAAKQSVLRSRLVSARKGHGLLCRLTAPRNDKHFYEYSQPETALYKNGRAVMPAPAKRNLARSTRVKFRNEY